MFVYCLYYSMYVVKHFLCGHIVTLAEPRNGSLLSRRCLADGAKEASKLAASP